MKLRSRRARLLVTTLLGLDLLGGVVTGVAHADSAPLRSVEINLGPLLVQSDLDVRVRGARVVQAKGRRRASLTVAVEVGAGTPSVTTTEHQKPTEECAVGDEAVAGTVNRTFTVTPPAGSTARVYLRVRHVEVVNKETVEVTAEPLGPLPGSVVGHDDVLRIDLCVA